MRASRQDIIIYWLMRGVTYSILAAIGYIVFDIIWNGAPALNLTFLTDFPRRSADRPKRQLDRLQRDGGSGRLGERLLC